MTELLSAEDVAREAKIPLSTAREKMRREMKHLYLGKHLRVTRQGFTAWLDRNQHDPQSTNEDASGGAGSGPAPDESSESLRGAETTRRPSLNGKTSSGKQWIRPTGTRRKRA